MRLGRVIGRVTLSQAVPSVTGARWLIVNPLGREQYLQGLEGEVSLSREPSLVAYDALGGGVGQIIGFVEGREAAVPFASPTPIDAICTALVDEMFYRPPENSGDVKA